MAAHQTLGYYVTFDGRTILLHSLQTIRFTILTWSHKNPVWSHADGNH